MLKVLIRGFVILAILATVIHLAGTCGNDTDSAALDTIGDALKHVVSGSAADDATDAGELLTLQPLRNALEGNND